MDEILSNCYDIWSKNWRNERIPTYVTEHDHNYLYNKGQYLAYGIIVNEKPHGIWWILIKNEFNEYVIKNIMNYNNGLLDGYMYYYGSTQSIYRVEKYIKGVEKNIKKYNDTKYIGRCGSKKDRTNNYDENIFQEDIEKYYPIPDILKNIIPKSFYNSEICEEKYLSNPNEFHRSKIYTNGFGKVIIFGDANKSINVK